MNNIIKRIIVKKNRGKKLKKFYIAYDTDVGIKKKTNQDSLLLKGCSEEHERHF